MHYEKTKAHKLIRKEIRNFLKKELVPIVPELEDEGRFAENIFRKIADLGFLSLLLPEKYGWGRPRFLGYGHRGRRAGKGPS